MRRWIISAMLCLLPLSALAQDRVTATSTISTIPVLRGDRPVLDRDLQVALKLFNGQNVIDNATRSVGIVDRTIAGGMRGHGGDAFIAEGVVLRTEAHLAPDLTGMVTVLTVLPTGILQMPTWYPPPAARPATRRNEFTPVVPPRPLGSTLRFVLAGGTVYFDDNNGATVRQAGVRYPGPGEALIFFGETIASDSANQPPSSVLLLTGACALQGRTCVSIDGNAVNSDALTALVPGGVTTAQAFNLTAAPIADRTREGIRGLAGSLEARYNLALGDLRLQAGPEIPMTPFVPVATDETIVRAHILSSNAEMTLGGLGVVTHALAGVDHLYAGTMPRERTLDITQRGGLLWKDSSNVLAALTAAQQPLVEGGDYFLTVGRTADNRWELRAAWRVVNGQVFATDRPRTQVVTHDGGAWWKSVDAFEKARGLPQTP